MDRAHQIDGDVQQGFARCEIDGTFFIHPVFGEPLYMIRVRLGAVEQIDRPRRAVRRTHGEAHHANFVMLSDRNRAERHHGAVCGVETFQRAGELDDEHVAVFQGHALQRIIQLGGENFLFQTSRIERLAISRQ